ncbi:MAG: hypothetical protein M3365_07955, partial [Gemmatimonadota bacterium]|nr:hypothetical protein [Gemmatimonadota bacterium]
SVRSRREVERLFGSNDVGDADIAAVVLIVEESGGFDYARARGAEFAERAEDALSELPDSAARAALSNAISYVMERHS